MTLRIADTFTAALDRLTAQEADDRRRSARARSRAHRESPVRVEVPAAAPAPGEQVIGVVLLSDLERALQAHAGAQGRDLRTT